eukprot:COSAG02_NODE_236_length_27740_cov_49.156073_4_plen_108_part_00
MRLAMQTGDSAGAVGEVTYSNLMAAELAAERVERARKHRERAEEAGAAAKDEVAGQVSEAAGDVDPELPSHQASDCWRAAEGSRAALGGVLVLDLSCKGLAIIFALT